MIFVNGRKQLSNQSLVCKLCKTSYFESAWVDMAYEEERKTGRRRAEERKTRRKKNRGEEREREKEGRKVKEK